MAKAPRSLTGRVVAITGGARGIGRATAQALLAHGAKVAVGDLDVPLAEQAARELGPGAVGLALDVTDRASFSAFLDGAERQLGPLEVLINNAGIMPVGPFLNESDATARRIVEVNLHGVMLGCKLALERFMPRGAGHLVNVASMAGKVGFPSGVTYCASKHAVVGLSEALRAEVRSSGVAVSIVMPGMVDTELGAGLWHRRAMRGIRPVAPERVAAAVVEALQTGRVDVYVPRTMSVLARAGAVLPRRLSDVAVRLLRSDRVMLDPDPALRRGYDARIG